jgi:hypothetical protein
VPLFGASRRKSAIDDCEMLAAFMDVEAEAFVGSMRARTHA